MKCSICGGQMVSKKLDVDKAWKGRTITFRGIEADVCEVCGIKVYKASDIAMMESLIESTLDKTDYPNVMDVEEVSRFLRVTPQSIYNMLRDGRLAATKIGREWRFSREAVFSLVTKEAPPATAKEAETLISGEQIDEVVRRIVTSLHPEKVVLFGSYARGNPTKDSDLDLLVVKQTDLPRPERGKEARRSLRGMKVPIDLLVYTPAEVKEGLGLGQSFLSQVMAEGKVLYE